MLADREDERVLYASTTNLDPCNHPSNPLTRGPGLLGDREAGHEYGSESAASPACAVVSEPGWTSALSKDGKYRHSTADVLREDAEEAQVRGTVT